MTPTRIEIAHPEGGVLSALNWHMTSPDHLNGSVEGLTAPPASAGSKAQAGQSEPRPLLVFSHATGFHSATYEPLFRRLCGHMDIIAPDARGHGYSSLNAHPHSLRSWKRYYGDLAHVVDSMDQPVFLAGHSIGGLCSLAVAASRPERVKGVIAMDPVMLDPSQGIPFRLLQWVGRSDRFPLAAGAKRRRAQFASLDEAYNTYRQRRSFATWPDEWLRAYVDGAFAPSGPDSVQLRCKPAWESRTFAMGECWPWRFVGSIKAPVSLLVAQKDTTCSLRSRRKARAIHPHWDIIELAGSTHFLPMEKTADVARIAIDFVKAHAG